MGYGELKLGEQLRGLALLKAQKKEFDDALKRVKENITQQEKAIIKAMVDLSEEQDLDNPADFAVAVDGRRYGLTVKTYFSVPADRKHEIFQALRDLGQGDLIEESMDKGTLTNALAGIMKANNGLLPDEYAALNLSTFEDVKIFDRKA